MDARARFRHLALGSLFLLVLGLLYALWVGFTGLALPCPFRALTGLLCPGCGVTTLCLSLLRLDLAGAWRANPVLLLLLPVLAALALELAVGYVRTGPRRLRRWEEALCWAMIVLLLAWGVVRNIL